MLNQLLLNSNLKMTALRQDVLDIFLGSQKPLSAYDVLARLKLIRPKAEPPTVYRVIEYFIEKQVVHRIETGNKYVCCSQLGKISSPFHGVLFLCRLCQRSYEFLDEEVLSFIKRFGARHDLLINEPLIEVKGVCGECAATS